MSNEIVKYSNDLNLIKEINALSEKVQDVFFAIVHQLRNCDGYEIEIPFTKLFDLAGIETRNTDFRKEIIEKFQKIQDFKHTYIFNEIGDIKSDVAFPEIWTDSRNSSLKIKVAKNFKDEFLMTKYNFTRYELSEFVALSGRYAKTLYRFLKQYRSSGIWRIKMSDFKNLMCVPNSYNMCDIDKRILKPTIKQLSSDIGLFDAARVPFEQLCYKKIKKGREIDMLEFYFKPQNDKILSEAQAKISIMTIAHEIKSQKSIKSLKTKIEKEKIVNSYINRNFTLHNPQKNYTLIIKFKTFENVGSEYVSNFVNVDNNQYLTIKHDSIEYLINFLKKNVV